MKRFDCHCHIFNIVDVGLKAILEQLHETETVMKSSSSDEFFGVENGHHKKSSIILKIKKIAELIKIFSGSSEKILSVLDEHYHGKYTYFPLMFDGDFLLDAYHEEDLRDIKSLVLNSLSPNAIMKQNKEQSPLFSALQHGEEEDVKVILDFMNKMPYHPESNDKNASIKSGFEKQYEDIVAISEIPKYKGRFFPFLGVDPRRKEIKEYLPQVGEGKLFAGVKVYPPNGFSPMDPVLVGKESVFEYCSDNQIPVVSHCSYGGFATPTKHIAVNGMIIPEGETHPVDFNAEYSFKTGLKAGFDIMVKKRARVLNNPLIWEKVLEKYPNLVLVLAHFVSENTEWINTILRLMKKYPNLYTDVSCMSNQNMLDRVKIIYNENPDIQDKILYGSDYFLDMFFNDSFKQFLNRMKKTFGDTMFDQLSSVNPQLFMAKWYKENVEDTRLV